MIGGYKSIIKIRAFFGLYPFYLKLYLEFEFECPDLFLQTSIAKSENFGRTEVKFG